MQPKPKPPRPAGVVILGFLGILIGLALLGFAFGRIMPPPPGEAVLKTGSALVGLLQLAVSIGFFSGRGWAWTLGIILSIGSALFISFQFIFSFPYAGFIINLPILYYLTRPHVKAYFGKGLLPPTFCTPGR